MPELSGMTRPAFVRTLSAAGALAATPLLQGAAAPGKPERTTLRVGLPVDGATLLPVYLAAARTYAQEGLDVTVLGFRGDAEVAQALAGDSVDLNVASLNGLINMISAGQPAIGFYAGFYQADFAWLSQPSIKMWEDLRGKSVAISTFGSLTDALTRYVLRKHKLEPERDVQLIQGGGSPSAYQALKLGRIGAAILLAPFKWQGLAEGMNLLGSQAKDVAPQWPKHIFLTKTKFLNENPNTVAALLRAHVRAIRLAHADREFAVSVFMDRLKFTKPWAERAYDELLPGWNERGTLPERSMRVFWEIGVANGDVKAPWPDDKLLDRRYVDSFAKWAP